MDSDRPERRKTGRPPGKVYPCRVTTQIDEEDYVRILTLAKKAGSISEALRRIITWGLEGVEE